MYVVVGCSDCRALWVVEGHPETTGCPRCGTRHRFDRLKPLATAEDEGRARAARAALLAERADSDLGAAAFAEMATEADSAGRDPAEYLSEMGVDPAAAAAAAEGAEGDTTGRRETVREALEDLDTPDEAAVVEYATERGVPADDTRDLLERLVRAGEATESDGSYRLL